MGQAESAGDGSVTPAPKDVVEVGRRRQDLYHRLGVLDQTPQPYRVPARTAEAPGVLESTSRDRASSAGSSAGGRRNSGDGEESRIFEMDIHEMRCQDDFRLQYLQRFSHQKASGALDGEGREADSDADDGEQQNAAVRTRISDVDQHRRQFLQRLSYKKVWVPRAQRPPKHQTVVIFDWDDTLLCTTYLNMRQAADQPLSPLVERHLRGIEAADRKLLELAMKVGRTFIITNAMNGWVEYSAAKYMPDLLPQLQRVPVISARGKFESMYPGEVSKWKEEAFLEVRGQLDSQIITNLISLGDSNFEMEAVHVMGKEFAQALVKTIKFRESPSPEELLKQLELVAQKFERIYENPRNLKIGLERKWVGNAQQQQQLQQQKLQQANQQSQAPAPSSSSAQQQGQQSLAAPAAQQAQQPQAPS